MPKSLALTRKHRRLRSEIEAIASAIDADHWNIEKYEPAERENKLELIKDQLVRGHVVMGYTLLDEYLTDIICNYYFRRRSKHLHYGRLWKTDRFKIFVQYLMDDTYLHKKLQIVQAIKPVPKEVSSAIARINDVRNDLTHSFFPQNRRRHSSMKKVMYRGVHLFTVEGIERFRADFSVAVIYLAKRNWGEPAAT